jgi:hypothetical protein
VEHTAAIPSGADLVATGVVVTTMSRPAVPLTQATPLLGETVLREYANTNLPPEIDLMLTSRLMENSLLFLKSAANQPLSADEDWAGLLRGQNAAHERFLPDQHVALNARGRLVDRWGTPLFFHVLGGGRWSLESSIYMSVITVSTVGFAELPNFNEVPGAHELTFSFHSNLDFSGVGRCGDVVGGLKLNQISPQRGLGILTPRST